MHTNVVDSQVKERDTTSSGPAGVMIKGAATVAATAAPKLYVQPKYSRPSRNRLINYHPPRTYSSPIIGSRLQAPNSKLLIPSLTPDTDKAIRAVLVYPSPQVSDPSPTPRTDHSFPRGIPPTQPKSMGTVAKPQTRPAVRLQSTPAPTTVPTPAPITVRGRGAVYCPKDLTPAVLHRHSTRPSILSSVSSSATASVLPATSRTSHTIKLPAQIQAQAQAQTSTVSVLEARVLSMEAKLLLTEAVHRTEIAAVKQEAQEAVKALAVLEARMESRFVELEGRVDFRIAEAERQA